MTMNQVHIAYQRLLLFVAVLFSSAHIQAAGFFIPLERFSNGGTNYSLTAQALADMTEEVVLAMGYVVGLLYVLATIVGLYNSIVIYVKLQYGEDGLLKSVLMLFGALLFLISATIVLPAFFGYEDFSIR